MSSLDITLDSSVQQRGRWREWLLPLFFLTPAILVALCFFILPVLLTLLFSLTNMSVSTSLSGFSWIGLDNYKSILDSPWTGFILKNTLFFVIGTLLLFNLGLGLVIAIACFFIPKPVSAIFQAIWLLPRITPSVVFVIMMKWAVADAPYGILNQLFSPLGLTAQDWMHAQPWLFIIAINGFVGASMGMILFNSAIQAIPKNHFIAAGIDGASNWQMIRYIILPQLKWPIMFTLAYQTLSLLASFEYILLTTNGGPGFYTTEVWALYAYHTAFSNYFGNAQYGYGSALAAILVVLGIVFSLIYFKLFRFKSLVRDPKIEIN